jgi:ABC-type glutathione transport system ATPase component
VRIENLRKTYSQGRWWEKRYRVTALDGINLTLEKGKTLAVVGRSGSGKSTLATCLAMLLKPDYGSIWFDGSDLPALPESARRQLRPQIQLIFQDSVSALSPRLSAAQIIEEPLLIQRRFDRCRRLKMVFELMQRVGLSPDWADRLPCQFSGGQRQRLAVARALILEPRLLILDEPFAGLDLSVRAQIVNLLIELQSELGLTFLFITHDYELIPHFSDRVALMDRGKILPEADIEEVLHDSVHAGANSVSVSANVPGGASKLLSL